VGGVKGVLEVNNKRPENIRKIRSAQTEKIAGRIAACVIICASLPVVALLAGLSVRIYHAVVGS
jgi:hypothetical protein